MEELFNRLREINKKYQRAGWLTRANLQASALDTVMNAFDIYQANPTDENLTTYNEMVLFYTNNIHR